MASTVLQVRMDSTDRKAAEKIAEKQGFSSLQEAVRVYVKKLSREEVRFKVQEQFPPVRLSPRAIRRYDKMTEDFKKGKNIFVAENVEDLMDQLNGNKDPVPFKISKALQGKGVSQPKSRRDLQRNRKIFYS